MELSHQDCVIEADAPLPPALYQPAARGAWELRIESDEHLVLIREWEKLTPQDIDPMEHAWRGAFQRAKRLVRDGRQDSAAELLAQSCVYPNTHLGHFRLLFRLWRRQNVLDCSARLHETVRRRVLAMMHKDEELMRGLAMVAEELEEKPVAADAFAAHRNLRARDMKALLGAARALRDPSNEEIALAWLTTHGGPGSQRGPRRRETSTPHSRRQS